jgi:hypothetical protein
MSANNARHERFNALPRQSAGDREARDTSSSPFLPRRAATLAPPPAFANFMSHKRATLAGSFSGTPI